MKKLMIAVAACTVAFGAIAEEAAFQLSLTPDIALQSRDTVIKGVSLGVWNENPGSQWQAGFVNGTSGDGAGVQWFVFLPTIYNYAENYTGAQLGVVNYASGDFVGLQWGLVNWSPTTFKGVQLGLVNGTGQLTGLQLGCVNYAETARNGLQVGLVNVIEDNEWFKDFPNDLAKGMVIVNWSFGDE